METLEVPVPTSYKPLNELTLTGGIAGPIITQFPFNITNALNQPQITADEAIFILGQLHHYRNTPGGDQRHLDDLEVQTAQTLAFQRLLSHQNADGSFAFCHGVPSTFVTASALEVLRRLQTSISPSNTMVIGKSYCVFDHRLLGHCLL